MFLSLLLIKWLLLTFPELYKILLLKIFLKLFLFLLPAAYYDVPGRISLNDGERESSVKLLVKKELLATDPFFVEGNRYILPLRITNPTRYELNSALSLTMFIFEPK